MAGSVPSVLFGMVPLFRGTVRSSATATATNVEADDSGLIFINLSTNEHTYTLPVVGECKGRVFIFYNAETTAATVITGGTASLLMGGDGATGSSLTDSANIGDWAIVFGDGTNFFAICGSAADSDSWDTS